jgi:ADP-ribose pyrophosphatase YjhB (NUDIX family)
MNISIYYNTKKVSILSRDQNSHNQSFKAIDNLSSEEIYKEFDQFINHVDQTELILEAETAELGLERFRKAFKYIQAAGGLIQQDDRYLFIYRMGTWDLPKGKLEKNEEPRDAAIRECEEECGITELNISRELNPTYHMYEHQKHGYALKKTFWYLMTSTHKGPLVPQTEEMIEKVEWLTEAQIKETVYENTYFAILDVIRDGV